VRQLVSDNPSLFSALPSAGTLKQATLIKFPKAEAAAELIGKVELDALAMGTGPCTICQESYPAPECWRK
jgi:hypothetical protein